MLMHHTLFHTLLIHYFGIQVVNLFLKRILRYCKASQRLCERFLQRFCGCMLPSDMFPMGL